MKIAILDIRVGNRNPKNSFTVAYRNLLSLKDALDADLFCDVKDLKKSCTDYESIICGFGSTSTEAEKSTEFLKLNKNAKLFWLVGEYEQSTFAPLFYAKRPYSVIKNFEHPMSGKQIDKQHFVNLNLLLADTPPEPLNALPRHKYDSVYYGRWRQDRSKYFKMYLGHDVMLSTSVKNMKKYKAYGVKASYCKPLQWQQGKETLCLFRSSIYLEDIFTHTHYNCPANRFYEALFCGSIVLPHIESANTWDRAGYDMTRRYFSSYEELSILIDATKNVDTAKSLLEEQYEWGLDATRKRHLAINEIKEILRSS